MPIIIVAEKGKPMDMEKKKKGGFLNYGKEDDEPAEDEEESGEEASPSQMRLMHLAEQTGVDDPEALIKLIKACMASGE